MADVPAVSVVIALYNKGPHIARALNSVLAQTFQDFEVIVVDDGSIDNGAEVVRGFRDRRVQLIQQENQGVSAARNRGIEAARAELIAFLDADDEWMPDHLEILIRLRNFFPEAGAYTTAYLIKYPDSRLKTPNYHKIPGKYWEGLIPSYFKSAAYGSPPVSTSVVAIPKLILKEMKGFSMEAWWGEDTDLWGRIALKYPIAFSWEGLGIYHTEATNRLCNRTEPITEHVFVKTAKNLLNAGDIPMDILEDLLAYLDKKQIETAWQNYRSNRPDLARKNLKACLTDKHIINKYWAWFWTFIPLNYYYCFSKTKSKLFQYLR